MWQNRAFAEKIVLDSLQDRETWYHQDRWFWPLLCSGPAVSLPSERRGFFVSRTAIQSRSDCFCSRASEAMPSNIWSIDGDCAQLSLPGLNAQVDSLSPRHGLSKISVRGAAWNEAHLLGVSGAVLKAAGSRVEWYARENELVAAYETGAPHSARIDLRWQAVAGISGDPWFARIDFVISVRTDRLDWRHDVSAESDIHGAAKLPCSSFALTKWEYAEFIHPADLRKDEPANERKFRMACRLHRRLFQTETLEKGVILRARLRGLFFPVGVEPAVMEACYGEFIASDPPLGI